MPMGRQFVHLSASQETAEMVAGRHAGEIILMKISTSDFIAAGHQLFQAENGVWLTKHVPANFATIQ